MVRVNIEELGLALRRLLRFEGILSKKHVENIGLLSIRVAGLGRLSAGAKMAKKPFVKRVFTIFATNASFLRVISNFRI